MSEMITFLITRCSAETKKIISWWKSFVKASLLQRESCSPICLAQHIPNRDHRRQHSTRAAVHRQSSTFKELFQLGHPWLKFLFFFLIIFDKIDEVGPSEIQPSHHLHAIALSPVAQNYKENHDFRRELENNLSWLYQLLLLYLSDHPQPSLSLLSAPLCSAPAADSPLFRVIWHSQDTTFRNLLLLLLAGRNTLCFAAVCCASAKAFRSCGGRRSITKCISSLSVIIAVGQIHSRCK